MDEINRRRLEWVAGAKPGQDWPPELFPMNWGPALTDAAKAALEALPVWRPIAEAPIPPADGLPIYWSYACLIQTVGGRVAAGFVRYVDRTTRGRSPRVLRWYEGVPQSYTVVPDPKYFMPLPAKRED